MKKSLKIALGTGLVAVFALTLTFCGSKPAETQAEVKDSVTTETDSLTTTPDSLNTQAPDSVK